MKPADWETMPEPSLELGHHAEPVGVLDPAMTLAPSLEVAWMLKTGLSLHALGAYEDAIACFDRATQLNPDNGRAWYQKSVSLCKTTRPDRWREMLSCLRNASQRGEPRADEAIRFLLKLTDDPE